MATGGWDEYDDQPAPPRRNAHFRMGRLGPDVFGVHGYHEDTYEYIKPNERGEQRSYLTANILHHEPKTTVAYSEGPMQFSGHVSTPLENRALNDLLDSHETSQPKLFGMASLPGHSKVDWLGGTKEGRVHALTMLGIAENRTQQDFGRSLAPSENLSPHSARFVGKLAARGALGPDTETEVSNDIDFNPIPLTPNTEPSERLSSGEVARGRNTARRFLRQHKRR